MNREIINTPERSRGYSEYSAETPGINTLKRLGKRLPINPYSWHEDDNVHPYFLTYNGPRREVDARGVGSVVDAFNSGEIWNYNHTIGSGGPRRGSLLNQLNSRLMTKVREQDVNLGVALGEYRETAEMFTKAAKALSKSLRAARKRDFVGAVRALSGSSRNSTLKDVAKAGANSHLQWTYGLKPFLSDVYGSIEALQKAYSRPIPQRISVRSSVRGKIGFNDVVNITSGKSSYSFMLSGAGTYRASGRVDFYVDNPLMRTLDQLGVTNPLVVAWELVPYSFVADWFSNIGDFLLNVVPPQGVSFSAGYISERFDGDLVQRTYLVPNPENFPPDWPYPLLWDTRANRSEMFKERTPLSSWPKVALQQPDLSLTMGQVRNAVALVTQSITGKPSRKRRSVL